LLTSIIRAFGYEITRRDKHPSSNSHLINFLNQYDIDTVLNIGANFGQFAKMLRSEGYLEEIHSFEPVSTSYDQLCHVARNDKKWFTYKLAMSDFCGEDKINVVNDLAFSSFLKPNGFAIKDFKNLQVDRTETVQVSTLNDFFNHHMQKFSTRRIFLQMDTQGFDLKVFAGASEHLQNIIGILSEISFTPIYNEMPHYLEALKYYEEYGFVVTGLYPISRKKDLAVIEMDCMLLNNNRA